MLFSYLLIDPLSPLPERNILTYSRWCTVCIYLRTIPIPNSNEYHRPVKEHTELEEELHEKAHIDYDRVAIVPNPSVAALYEDALVYETGSAITSSGALTAYSGAKTGRSPLDKRIVKEPGSENDIWWGWVPPPPHLLAPQNDWLFAI